MVAKLMSHVPLGGKPYCEPYMGGASLFFARPPAPVEVLNDLNGDLVTLFRCLQDKASIEELTHRLRFTPNSRAEFGRALEVLEDKSASPLMRAWATFVAQNQGFSGVAVTLGNWRRSFGSAGGMASTTSQWLMRLSMLEDWHKRLLMAQVDNRDALEVIRYWDNPDAVFYVDPPYHIETRVTKSVYASETDHEHHVALVETLLACKGFVALSGYSHPVYQPLEEAGWTRIEFETACHAAGRGRGSKLRGKGAALQHAKRTEVLWINRAAQRQAFNEVFYEC